MLLFRKLMNKVYCRVALIHTQRKAASLTIEASFVLPVFIFSVGFLISLMMFIGTSVRIQLALYNVATELSMYQYAKETLDNDDIDIADIEDGKKAKGVLEKGIEQGTVKTLVLANLGSKYPGAKYIKGGLLGLSFKKTSIANEQRTMDIIVEYDFKSPFDIFGIGKVPMCQRAKLKSFAGDSTYNKAGKYVYIAPNGVVYHTNRNCQYIQIKTEYHTLEELPSLRNENRSKYYPCSKCGKSLSGTIGIYITQYGNRYHTDKNCSEIKREAKKMELKDAVNSNYNICSKCKSGGFGGVFEN